MHMYNDEVLNCYWVCTFRNKMLLPSLDLHFLCVPIHGRFVGNLL